MTTLSTDPGTKPLELTFVRHGKSEPNVVQNAHKAGEDMVVPALYRRHDSEQRLCDEGRLQVVQAREFMLDNGLDPDGFDARLVTTFIRGIETAMGLGTPATMWEPASKVIERDWGFFGDTPAAERSDRYPADAAMLAKSSFYARFSGGESIYDVSSRVHALIDSLIRHYPNQRVLIVTHGEYMWSARFDIERLLPWEWMDLDDDPAMRLPNCSILTYSRSGPELDPEGWSSGFSNGWRRILNPINPELSPYGGEWVRLAGHRLLNGAEMARIVDRFPTLLDHYIAPA